MPSPSTRTISDQLLPAGGATLATTSCSLAGSVLLSPQAARASAPIEVRRMVRSRVMFSFSTKARLRGFYEALSARSSFDLSAGQAVTSALRPLIKKLRSEEHTSELQSLMRISYAVFCL